MIDNYKTIEHQLRKYSFEFLKVSEEPLNMLQTLNPNSGRDAFLIRYFRVEHSQIKKRDIKSKAFYKKASSHFS